MILRHCQEIAADWLRNRAAGGLLADVGAGKTATVLRALGNHRALVVAPKRVAQLAWPEQIDQWAPGRSWSILHGKKGDYGADILLTNPEQLENVLASDMPDTLILDESHIWRNGVGTKRFKVLQQAMPRFKRRWSMTATPAPRALENLWAQAYLLDGGKALGKYYTAFLQNYFYKTAWDKHHLRMHPWTQDEVYERVGELFHRTQMPPAQLYEHTIQVDLPEAVRRQIAGIERDLEDDLRERVRGGEIGGAMANKMRQLASGAVYDGFGNWERVHNAKLDALSELIDSMQGNPLLVFYEFEHERERIVGKFGLKHWLGRGSGDEGAVLFAWNQGQIAVLPMQVSAGVGLNMHLFGGSKHCCFFTLPWDLAQYIQAAGRLRPNLNPVFVHSLIVTGSIEQRVVWPALLAKRSVENALLDYFAGAKEKG